MLLNLTDHVSISRRGLLRGTAVLGTVAMISSFNAGTAIAETAQVSDDLTLYYEVVGSGDKTILFVPGGGMSSAVFEKNLRSSRVLMSTEPYHTTHAVRGSPQNRGRAFL